MRMRRAVSVGACVVAVAACDDAAFGSGPVLLADVDDGRVALAASSSPIALTRVRQGLALFYADDGVHGYELWRTDGSAAGTFMVGDLNPGPLGSAPVMDDRSVFKDFDAYVARTVVGNTFRGRAPLFPGEDPFPYLPPFPHQQFTVTAGGTVFFFGHRPATGTELWRTDGTPGGSRMVADIRVGVGSCTDGCVVIEHDDRTRVPAIAVGDKIYFTANDGVRGPALWVSDGTEQGTRAVAVVNEGGARFSGPHSLCEFQGRVFFAGRVGLTGYEPWIYDPVTGRVDQIDEINTQVPWDWLPADWVAGTDARSWVPPDTILFPHTPVVIGPKLYFIGMTGGGGSSVSTSVFSYDGRLITLAAGGEELRGDGEAGKTPLVSRTFGLRPSGDKLLFGLRATLRPGALYAHDPAEPEPNSRPLTAASGDLEPAASAVYPGGAYFIASGELWRTDGTPAGTGLVRDLRPGATPLGDLRTAAAYLPPLHAGSPVPELTMFDYASTPRIPAEYEPPLAADGACYFAASVTGTPVGAYIYNADYELYRSDGTAAGTGKLKEINPSGSADPKDFLALAPGVFLFTAVTPENGRELWRSDGTAGGTALLKDLTGQSGSGASAFTEVPQAGVFFGADDASHGRELWVSDGSPAGTRLRADIEPGPAGSRPEYLTPAGGKLYFGALRVASGYELYAAAGGDAGVAMVTDLWPGPRDGLPIRGYAGRLDGIPSAPGADRVGAGASFVELGGRLLFMGDDGAAGREPYTTDGTAAGTLRLADIYAGERSSLGWTWTHPLLARVAPTDPRLVRPTAFVKAAGTAYFAAWDAAHAAAVRREDYLTPPRLINPNAQGHPDWSGGGGELWRTDGTPVGTVLASDINARGIDGGRQFGSDPRNLTPLSNAALPEGSLVFYADDGWVFAGQGAGRELWAYDAGTGRASLVLDINPAPPEMMTNWSSYRTGSSFVDRPMTVLSGAAYFAADDGASGIELWRTDGTAAGTCRVADLNSGPPSSDPGPFFALGERLVFQAADSPTGEYRMYACEAGGPPRLLSAHVHPVRGDAASPTAAAWNGRVYFSGYSDVDGRGVELYSTDGTQSSVRLEADINPGPQGSSPRSLTSTASGLFFSATDGVHGLEPHVLGATPVACVSDFDGQGGTDLLDIFAFLQGWFAGCTAPGPAPCTKSADVDGLNGVDLRDVFYFLQHWFQGC